MSVRPLSLIGVVVVLAHLGCTKSSTPSGQDLQETTVSPGDFEATIAAGQALASEAVYVLYPDERAPLLADVWIPPNESGVTLAQLWGDPSSGRLDRVTIWAGAETLAEIRATPDGLIGMTVEGQDDIQARLERIEGGAWTWSVVEPGASPRLVTVPMPAASEQARAPRAPAPAGFAGEGVPIRTAAFSQPSAAGDPFPDIVRAVTLVTSEATVPLTWVFGEAPAFVRDGLMLRSGCTTDDREVRCRVDQTADRSSLIVTTDVTTRFDAVEGGQVLYRDLNHCLEERNSHNVGGIGLGTVVGGIGTVVGGALGNGIGLVGGVVVGGGTNATEPVCGGLVTNQALIDDAYLRHGGVNVEVTWDWFVFAPGEDASAWDVVAEPAGVALEPFRFANRGGMTLAPVTVSLVRTRPEADEPAPEVEQPTSGGSLEGAVFRGTLGDPPLNRWVVTETRAPVTVTVGADGTATIDYDLTSRVWEGNPNRPGCYRLVGNEEGIPIRPDGSFAGDVTTFSLGYVGPRTEEDPCRRPLGPESGPLPVTGHLDASTGRGTIQLEFPGTPIEGVLVRE